MKNCVPSSRHRHPDIALESGAFCRPSPIRRLPLGDNVTTCPARRICLPPDQIRGCPRCDADCCFFEAGRFDVVLFTAASAPILLGAYRLARWIRTPHIVVNAHWQRPADPPSQRRSCAWPASTYASTSYSEETQFIMRYSAYHDARGDSLSTSHWLNQRSARGIRSTGGSSYRDYPTFRSRAAQSPSGGAPSPSARSRLAPEPGRDHPTVRVHGFCPPPVLRNGSRVPCVCHADPA